MKTIEDIKQELKARITDMQAHCDEHPRSVMLHHSQQLQSDRALLTAIEGLESVMFHSMRVVPRYVANKSLQTIREQWEGGK